MVPSDWLAELYRIFIDKRIPCAARETASLRELWESAKTSFA
jgi:hypothetical protein